MVLLFVILLLTGFFALYFYGDYRKRMGLPQVQELPGRTFSKAKIRSASIYSSNKEQDQTNLNSGLGPDTNRSSQPFKSGGNEF